MLSAYVNATDMEGAEKFFKRLKQDGLEPSIVTYGTLIKGYAKIINLDKMMEKYEEMRGFGLKANETIYTTIMDAHGKNEDFDSAVVWYKEMVSSRVVPDKKAKNILLSLAKTGEEQAEAKQLIGDDVDDFVMSNKSLENEKSGENEEDFSENGDSDEEDGGDEVIDLNDVVTHREDLLSLAPAGAL